MIKIIRLFFLGFSFLTLSACCNSGCDGGMSSFASQFSQPVVASSCNQCGGSCCSGTGGW